MSRSRKGVRFVEQVYDFSCGELRTRFEFRAESATASIEIVNFCSRSLPTAVLQLIDVKVDRPCELTVTAGISQVGVPGSLVARSAHRTCDRDSVAHGSLLWETSGGLSRCGAAYVTSFVGAGDISESRQLQDDSAPISTSYSVRARPGRPYRSSPDQCTCPQRAACRAGSAGLSPCECRTEQGL